MEENKNIEVNTENQNIVVPAPVAETTPTVEASLTPASVTESTPVVEATPVAEPALVAETTPAVEPTPTVEASSPPASVTESTPVVEPTPIIEPTPIVEETKSESNAETTIQQTKKRSNKTLLIVLIIICIFGIAIFFMTRGNTKTTNKPITPQDIKVDVGTTWGDIYLNYMLKEHSDIKNYEVSFIDVNDDQTPEMFFKYTDKSEQEALKILYIEEDGSIFETKKYHNFKLRYIYSLSQKRIDWYLFLYTKENYGAYTMISKIVDKMAFDSDIKTRTDAQLIEYGKKYYDSEYQPTFYYIKEKTMHEDFKKFVSTYNSYKNQVEETKNKILEKYKDYVIEEEKKEYITIIDKTYKLGSYFAEIPANEQTGESAYTSVIVLYDNNTIAVGGKILKYNIKVNEEKILLEDNQSISVVDNNIFNLNDINYEFKE